MQKPVYILSASAIGPCGDIQQTERKILAGDPEHTDIQDTLKTLTGLDIRRAGHFSELALVGSALAVKRLKSPLDPLAHLYFGTGLGEVQKTAALFKQTLDSDEGASSPYNFVNSVSSTTAFYIAKTVGLKSENITVCQEELSFEWALKLACGAIGDGAATEALAGGADEFSHPREDHMKRLPLDENQIMGEGGGWLCLSSEKTPAIGEVLDVRYMRFDGEDHGRWVEEISNACRPWLSSNPAYLLPGFRIGAKRTTSLVRTLPGAKVKRYLDYCGCFHTASAFGVASIFDMPQTTDGVYIHVNSDLEGRTIVVVFKAYGGGGR